MRKPVASATGFFALLETESIVSKSYKARKGRYILLKRKIVKIVSINIVKIKSNYVVFILTVISIDFVMCILYNKNTTKYYKLVQNNISLGRRNQ